MRRDANGGEASIATGAGWKEWNCCAGALVELLCVARPVWCDLSGGLWCTRCGLVESKVRR